MVYIEHELAGEEPLSLNCTLIAWNTSITSVTEHSLILPNFYPSQLWIIMCAIFPAFSWTSLNTCRPSKLQLFGVCDCLEQGWVSSVFQDRNSVSLLFMQQSWLNPNLSSVALGLSSFLSILSVPSHMISLGEASRRDKQSPFPEHGLIFGCSVWVQRGSQSGALQETPKYSQETKWHGFIASLSLLQMWCLLEDVVAFQNNYAPVMPGATFLFDMKTK